MAIGGGASRFVPRNADVASERIDRERRRLKVDAQTSEIQLHKEKIAGYQNLLTRKAIASTAARYFYNNWLTVRRLAKFSNFQTSLLLKRPIL